MFQHARSTRAFRVFRWLLSALGATALGLMIFSGLVYYANPGTPAYGISSDGILTITCPFDFAEDPELEPGQFPIDTDSLFGVVTYWFPSPGEAQVSWRWEKDDYGYRGPILPEAAWWSNWLHPLNTDQEGDCGCGGGPETTRISLACLVYLFGIPAFLLWMPWRRRAGKGCCIACAYDLQGLPPNTRCPECGQENVSSADSRLERAPSIVTGSADCAGSFPGR